MFTPADTLVSAPTSRRDEHTIFLGTVIFKRSFSYKCIHIKRYLSFIEGIIILLLLL